MKVSIIMLTYNHEKFINEAIQGVLIQQTSFPFELIVANDHSTDGTEQIVHEYRVKYPGIVKGFNNIKNLGPRYNFIKAYSQASGEYIAMCEGDDYWTDPEKLQKQVDFLEYNKDFALNFHNIRMINEAGEIMDDNRLPEGRKRDYDKYELLDNYIPTPTIVFRKLLNKLPDAFKKTDNGDVLLQALLTLEGKAKYLPVIQESVVRVHTSGLWSSRPYLIKWVSSLKTYYLVFKSLNSSLRKNIFENYVKIFEMASWDADHYQSKPYWYKYNFRYLQFCLTAGHYGKAWLICRRILNKIFTR